VPTYEYRCTNGHQYETREGFDAPSRQSCPTCGAQAKRVLYAPPIVFKGTGFYITDSRKGSSATLGSDTSSDSKKEDSKPAAATTSTSESSSSSDD
jgi:putative FmdB family regulatory protein